MHLDITTPDYKTLKYLLNAYLPGTAVWAFGSRVKFTSKPESDLDLVAFTQPGQESELAELKDAFAESDLPFKVDIMDWEAIPDNFKKNIEIEYLVVQDTNEEKEQLPPTWTKHKLADISKDIAMGPFGSNLKVDNFIEKGVPVIRGMNLNNGGLTNNSFAFVSEEKANSLKRCLAYPDDLVFTHRGTLGQVAIIPHNAYPKYLVSQSQMRLAVNKEILNPIFLYYFFKSPLGQKELLKNSSQVGVPAIANPTKSLKDVNISIPDLKTQTGVAFILSSLDQKIELNQQMNQTLESTAQAIFKEWFVNFNFPGFDGKLVDGLPKGWRLSTLGEIVDVKGGTTPSTSVVEYWDGEFYWTTPKDLSNIKSPVLLDTERKITKAGVGQIGSGILPRGTLLLSSRAPIGYLAISQVPISINQGYIAIQKKKVSNLFMLFWLKQNMEVVKGRSNGSTFQEISKSKFKEIETIFPDPDILKEFDVIINPIFEKIVSNEIENKTLIQVRDSLLPKLMTGKIEVKT